EDFLRSELEVGAHEAFLRARAGVAVAARAQDPRVLDDGGVALPRFFGLVLEREERRDVLHSNPPLRMPNCSMFGRKVRRGRSGVERRVYVGWGDLSGRTASCSRLATDSAATR